MAKPILIPFSLAASGQAPVFPDTGKHPRRFRKDAIRVGKYVARNPVDGSDLELNVTPERIKNWKASFSRMREAGVKVDLTIDHKSGAEAKRGEIVAMDGDDVLYFNTDLADDDGVTLVERCPEVSVEIHPNFRDGKGNEYGEAITAISVCRNPVVPGQSPFERIAASRTRTDETSFSICFTNSTTKPKSPPRSDNMFSQDQLKKIREQLDLGEDAKDSEVAEKIVLSLGQSGDDKTAKLRQDLDAANKKNEELQTKLTEAEKSGEPVKLSREVEVMSKRMLSQDLQQLVKDASITPACSKKLEDLLSTPVMLSVSANQDAPNYAGIIDALKENKTDELLKIIGEKTGSQTVTLSRDTPGGESGEVSKELQSDIEAFNKSQAGAA